MAQTLVTCPNCETSFKVNVDATRGKCPSCDISLVFEDAPAGRHAPQKPSPEKKSWQPETPAKEKREVAEAPVSPAVEETVDIHRVEAAVDAIVERTGSGTKIRAADIAAVDSIEMERDYSDVEKKVEKLLSKE